MANSDNWHLVVLVIGEVFLSILMLFSGSVFYETFQNKAYYLNIDFFLIGPAANAGFDFWYL